MGNRFARHWYYYDALKPDIELKSSFSFMELNSNIEIIATPGHSIGSLSIMLNDEFAVVGDVLFGGSKKTILPHFADDKKELFRTWKWLLESTECTTFFPGHGKPINRERLEKELQKKYGFNLSKYKLKNSH